MEAKKKGREKGRKDPNINSGSMVTNLKVIKHVYVVT